MLKEKQLTQRATKRPVEYNYTNADIHHQDTTPADGYQFEYPVNWTADPSTNKVIGIRRINYRPTSLDIVFAIHIDGKIIALPAYVFTDQNTFEECINRITVDINEGLKAQSVNFTCVTRYDKNTGYFNMCFENTAHVQQPFKLDFNFGYDEFYDGTEAKYKDEQYIHYKSEFLKLFNHIPSKNNIDYLWELIKTPTTILYFTNVWNRDSFYCHASFSDSPKQIIGINHDFWPTPSVFYAPGDNSNDFNVYFTTDTVHRILPRNGVMLIQLSYIYNYTNSMLSYV